MSGRNCTCDVRAPRRGLGVARSLSGYAIYLSFMEDDTRFDPACPYHGDNGTMVAVLPSSGSGRGTGK